MLYCKCMKVNCPKEHWADTEAAKNPHRYGIAEWSATYDTPHHLYPGCPNDTDGDGDCGGPACPNCGQQSATPTMSDGEDKKWPPSSMETK